MTLIEPTTLELSSQSGTFDLVMSPGQKFFGSKKSLRGRFKKVLGSKAGTVGQKYARVRSDLGPSLL